MLVPLYLAGTAATLDLGFPVRILEVAEQEVE
jgi:hypothetical protein